MFARRHYCVHAGVTSHIDDEYQMAGVDDPRILITTSRNPSARLKQFAKVCCLEICFPACRSDTEWH